MTLTKEQKETLAFLTSLSGQKDVTEALREGFSLPFAEMDTQDLNGFGSQEIRAVMAWTRKTVGWHHKLRKKEIYDFIRSGCALESAVSRLSEKYPDANSEYFPLSDSYAERYGYASPVDSSDGSGDDSSETKPPTKTPQNPVDSSNSSNASAKTNAPDMGAMFGPFVEWVESRLEEADVNAESLDMGKVWESIEHLVDEKIDEAPSGGTTVKVFNDAGREVDTSQLTEQHYRFGPLMRLVQLRDNDGKRLIPYLFGLPGRGKSFATKVVADALDFDQTGSLSCNREMTKYDLFGFFNPHKGIFEPTEFTRCVQEGGLFLLDELDRAPGEVLVVLNSLLGNGWVSIPGIGTVTAHEDFLVVAGGNTNMRGRDRRFAAAAHDAAFIDRLVFLRWDDDKHLEATINGIPLTGMGIKKKTCTMDDPRSLKDRELQEWANRVWTVRDELDNRNSDFLCSPRALSMGLLLLSAGFPQDLVEDMTIWKGMDRDTRVQVDKGASRRTYFVEEDE